ncbi:hypothetical protein LQ567_22725 [Niabella pedocola]|uniref:Uncharacterized protein n=1 Tax=Niabella pedocola TaxID=1752077 RepID=A0ABS8Q0A4_9BACT|nr:hypothetical protein [Niabella pedocola]MCD2425616.1 hypothetical protein [Niabella pedocola]
MLIIAGIFEVVFTPSWVKQRKQQGCYVPVVWRVYSEYVIAYENHPGTADWNGLCVWTGIDAVVAA